jgi:hypothetical protein
MVKKMKAKGNDQVYIDGNEYVDGKTCFKIRFRMQEVLDWRTESLTLSEFLISKAMDA